MSAISWEGALALLVLVPVVYRFVRAAHQVRHPDRYVSETTRREVERRKEA